MRSNAEQSPISLPPEDPIDAATRQSAAPMCNRKMLFFSFVFGVRKYHIGLEDERRLAMQRELAVLAIQNGMLGYQDRKVPVHVAPCRNSSESST